MDIVEFREFIKAKDLIRDLEKTKRNLSEFCDYISMRDNKRKKYKKRYNIPIKKDV